MTDVLVPVTLTALGPGAGMLVSSLAARMCDTCSEKIGCTNRSRSPAALPHRWAAVAGLVLAAAAALAGQSDLERALGGVFLILLLGLFLTDRRCFRLPDVMTAPLFATGLGLGTSSAGVGPALLAAVLGAGCLWLVAALYEMLRRRQGLGLGDVKMMAGVSAAVGLEAIAWVILLAAVLGLLAAIRAGGPSRAAMEQAVPFGCALALAGAAVWLAT